tara:strand:- start:5427 stop:6146 length:720 start_codon:yes stop_codon:yes gene_type:complete
MKKGTSRHPKTKKLARLLKINRHEAIGILNDLWEWAGDYATRGGIGIHENGDIADGIDYQGDADALIAALSDSGWLDEHPVLRLVIHDWTDNCDEWIRKKIKRLDNVSTTSAVVSTTDSKQAKQGLGKVREGEVREGKGRESLWPVVSEHLPMDMQTAEMEIAWGEWEQHRKERKPKITGSAACKQAGQLAAMGLDRAIAAIDASIAGGYQGIFEPKSNGNSSGVSAIKAPPPRKEYNL